jgi:hypothetical protein
VPTDHVYVAAPWDERDGEPYLVARIVEILQPAIKPLPGAVVESSGASSASSSNGKTAHDRRLNGPDTSLLRLRVNYYFRTRDITNRYVADHRVLVASFHSDVVPADYIRGLCTVQHRDHIQQLEVYKRKPDAFYWHQVRFISFYLVLVTFLTVRPSLQMYDRYLHRYFDSVPTYKVKNAPGSFISSTPIISSF